MPDHVTHQNTLPAIARIKICSCSRKPEAKKIKHKLSRRSSNLTSSFENIDYTNKSCIESMFSEYSI